MASSSSVVVSVASSCLLLVSVTSGAPKYSQKYDKPGQLNKYPGQEYHYNMNYIPEEDTIADWNNPWNFNRDMRLPSFGPWMNRDDGRVSREEDGEDGEDLDNETVQKRSFQRLFRMFKKSLNSNSNNQEKRNFVPMLGKRNFVPMLG